MGQLGVYHDSIVTDKLLADSPKDSQLYIATGYFNLTYKYMHTILYKCEAKCRLLMAHPDVSFIIFIISGFTVQQVFAVEVLTTGFISSGALAVCYV